MSKRKSKPFGPKDMIHHEICETISEGHTKGLTLGQITDKILELIEDGKTWDCSRCAHYRKMLQIFPR